MSVETFQPKTALITLTENAIKHFEKKLKLENKSFIRLSTKESGCTGFAYILDFIEAPSPEDTLVAIQPNFTLAVAKSSLPLVQNTEIDYVTEGLNGVLKYNNPNVTDACGCGESFAVNG